MPESDNPDLGLMALYAEALPATRQGPLFNAVSYPTKISPEAVALFIATHTRPGDTVLDPFAGSGSTGLAAVLCERPTPRMLEAASARGIAPVWGARRAELFDISEFGTLSARVLTSPPDPEGFAAAAKRLLSRVKAAAAGWYDATDPSGQQGVVRHVIWSEIFICPSCGQETPYAEARVRYEPLRFVDEFVCVCGLGLSKGTPRATVTSNDPLTGLETVQRKRIPWRVYGKTGTSNWSRMANADDYARIEDLSKTAPVSSAPIAEMAWGDLHRSGYHLGMTHLHHLYTSRNFRAMALMWEHIATEPQEFHEALMLLALSFNATHATLMTRVVLKKDSKDFILTGSQSGVLYVSAMPVEKNIFIGIERKLKTFRDAFKLTHGSKSAVNVHTASSTAMNIPDNTVDYVFTDPPFGDYIPYAEVNQVNELWLDARTDTTHEAVVSTSQSKGIAEYERLLKSVFAEVSRTMAPDGQATIVFHSAKAKIWQALDRALRAANLEVHLASVLDKTQGSFKQGLGDASVKGDPLLLVRHIDAARSPRPPAMMPQAGSALPVGDVRAEMAEATRERAYSRYLGQMMVAGQPITVDADEFYRQHAKQDVGA